MPVSPKMEKNAKKVVILWVIPEVIPEFFCLVEGVRLSSNCWPREVDFGMRTVLGTRAGQSEGQP